jgi:hypothetical protein
MDGCWINHYISLGLCYTSFPWNGVTVENSELVILYTVLRYFMLRD